MSGRDVHPVRRRGHDLRAAQPRRRARRDGRAGDRRAQRRARSSTAWCSRAAQVVPALNLRARFGFERMPYDLSHAADGRPRRRPHRRPGGRRGARVRRRSTRRGDPAAAAGADRPERTVSRRGRQRRRPARPRARISTRCSTFSDPRAGAASHKRQAMATRRRSTAARRTWRRAFDSPASCCRRREQVTAAAGVICARRRRSRRGRRRADPRRSSGRRRASTRWRPRSKETAAQAESRRGVGRGAGVVGQRDGGVDRAGDGEHDVARRRPDRADSRRDRSRAPRRSST